MFVATSPLATKKAPPPYGSGAEPLKQREQGETRCFVILRLKQIDANLVSSEHVGIRVVLAASVHRAGSRRAV